MKATDQSITYPSKQIKKMEGRQGFKFVKGSRAESWLHGKSKYLHSTQLDISAQKCHR